MRQTIWKATGGDVAKWYWFFPQILWADRITIRRGLGCSPYFAVCGAHPVIPLDVEEATWLVEYPGEPISTAELIGLRARALAKHSLHVQEMRLRVSEEKRRLVRRYEEEFGSTIVDYDFKPGDLVLVRNTSVEKSLDRKMEQRYMGPMVVVRRTAGGSYLCCEMNGAMFHGKLAAFRVIPFEQRQKIEIPDNILDLIDLSGEALEELAREDDDKEKTGSKDLQFHKIRVKSKEELAIADAQDDDKSDTESYISDGDPDLDLDEIRRDHTNDGPRRSKRSKK